MEQAAFDAMMEKEFGSTASKRAGLNNATTEKRTSLRPVEQAKIDFIEDADTIALAGQKDDSRLTGYDAYETYHKGQLEDPDKGPATRRRLDRQKKRYSQEFGVDAGSVTDNDIYKQGAREGLMALHETVKAPGDAPWTPGPISEEWYTEKGGSNPAQLGSRETPLGLNVNVQQDGTGKYGRHLTQAFNPESGQNINEAMTNQYNPAIYSGGKFDKKATRDKKTLLETGKAYSDMSRDEKNQYNTNKYSGGGSGSGEGMLGEAVDMAQAAGVKEGADLLNMSEKWAQSDLVKPITDAYNNMATGIEEFFGGDGKLGVLSDDGKDFLGSGKSIQEMRGTSPESQQARDMFAGVDQKTRGKFSADMQTSGKQWEEGNYGASIKTAIPNLMYMLAESVPEMAGLMMSGGVGLMTAKRLSNQSEEYEKENGKPMSYGKMLETGVAIIGTLAMEKALVKTGVSGAIGNVGKGVGLGGRTGAVIGSAAGEVVQEYAEGVQEKYATQKEGEKSLADIATSSEAVHQGLLGGLMGGALRGAGEATGAVVGAPGDLATRMDEKRQREVGEYLVGDDAKLGQAFDDMSFADTKKSKVEVDNAKEEIKDIGSFEEAIASKNPLIKSIAEAQAKKQDDTDVEAGSETHIKNVVHDLERNKKAGEDVSGLSDFIGVDIENSSNEKISAAIYAMPKEKRNELLEFLDTKRTNRDFAQKLEDSGNFEKIKKEISDHIDIYGKAVDKNVEKMDTQLKHVDEGRKAAPKELKEGKIDTGKIQKKEPTSRAGMIWDAFSGKTTREARKELNTYSDESLKEAYESKDTPKRVKKYIEDVISKRKKAKEATKIDSGDAYSPRNRNETLYKGNKKLTLDTLRDGLRKREYTDSRDVDAMGRLIDSALEQKFITEEQGKVFKDRMDKIGSKAEAPSKEQLQQEADENAKFTEETGFDEKTMENKASEEVTRENLEEEAQELFDNNKADKETINKIEKIKEEDRTKEEKDSLEKLLKKIDNREERLDELKKDARNFTQHENNMNDAHSPMDSDWSYNKVETLNLDEAFTEAEKKALGIC